MTERKPKQEPNPTGPPYKTAWEGAVGTDADHLMRAAARNHTLRHAAQACLDDWRNAAKDLDRSMRSLPRSIKRLQHQGYGIRHDVGTNRLWLTQDGETRWLTPDVADAEDNARDLADMARRYFGHRNLGDLPAALSGIVTSTVAAAREAHPTLTLAQEELVRRMATGLALMLCEWFVRGDELLPETALADEERHEDETKEE